MTRRGFAVFTVLGIVSLVPLCDSALDVCSHLADLCTALVNGASLTLCCLFIWVAVKFGEKVYRSYALRTTGKSGWKLLLKGTTEMGTQSMP